MDRITVRNKIYAKIDELPTLPSTVTRLISLFEDKNSNVSLITEVIRKDPSLAAKILKVANSAYYGFSQKISDIERSVALLGFNMVKSLAVSIGVLKNLPFNDKNAITGKALWHHSITVAILMREMCKQLNHDVHNESVFITGLLHDIGIIVFEQFFSDLFREVLDEAQFADPKKMYGIEQRIIGLDHGEAGGMLLTRWNFPSVISFSVSNHHRNFSGEDENAKETALLKLADIISHSDIQKDENIEIPEDDLNPLLTCLGADRDFIYRISRFKESARDEITAFFNSVI